MNKPILVGYQPEGGDRAPVAFGVAAARLTGAPLVIAAAAGRGHHTEEEAASDRTGELAELRRELENDGIDVDARMIHGRSAPHALHAAAEELEAALLVIGSAAHHAGGRRLMGSTAVRLMHGAPCPLAVVPHGWTAGDGLRTIGVAYVDTPEGHEALHGAAALARRAGATLRVLSAAKPHGTSGTFGGGDGLTPAVTFEELSSAIRLGAEQAVAAATSAEGDDLTAEPDVSVGDPGDFLIGASRHVDLLVCGSRGYGPRRAVLLGGVSRRVTAEAECPVIVLARGMPASLQELAGAAATGS